MPQLEYFLACRSVQQDATTGEMSCINVLEYVTPKSFPHVISRVIAVSLWRFLPGEVEHDYQAVLVVTCPGAAPARFTMNFMNFTRGVQRCRAVQGILDIPLDQPGTLVFEVLLNNEHAGTHTVVVHPVGVRELPSAGERVAENRAV